MVCTIQSLLYNKDDVMSGTSCKASVGVDSVAPWHALAIGDG